MGSPAAPDDDDYSIAEIIRRNSVPRPDSAPVWYSRTEFATRLRFCGLSVALSLFLISWVAATILISSGLVV
ncbi:MAG TPA: hypothetical protein VEB21_02720, partial [Terriglobales bacterium]|nr:hypothetical protein [Terriglobales bacterium]